MHKRFMELHWFRGRGDCSQESEPHQLQSNFWVQGEGGGSDRSQESEPHQLQPSFSSPPESDAEAEAKL